MEKERLVAENNLTAEKLWETAKPYLGRIKFKHDMADHVKEEIRDFIGVELWKQCMDSAATCKNIQLFEAKVYNTIKWAKAKWYENNSTNGMVISGTGGRNRRAIPKIMKELTALEHSCTRDQLPEEKNKILAKYGVSQEELDEYDNMRKTISNDTPINPNDDESGKLIDFIEDQNFKNTDNNNNDMVKYRLAKRQFMEALSHSEADIFEKMMLNNHMSVTEYAEYKGCSKGNISQIYSRVCTKIQELPEGQKWAELYKMLVNT